MIHSSGAVGAYEDELANTSLSGHSGSLAIYLDTNYRLGLINECWPYVKAQMTSTC